jgi:glycine/serine hydroxymethyltransferase
MKEAEMEILGDFMLTAIQKRENPEAIKALHQEVIAFCRRFPVPGISLPS